MIRDQKDYPRPQFVRSQWENLNGAWQFAFDDENCGESEQWYLSFPSKEKILVPFTYETKKSGIQDESIHQCVWYQRTFCADSQSLLTGQDLLLHFEGCDYRTLVWINGSFVGEHTGGYTRFSFVITPYLVQGINTVTVKAEDCTDEAQPRGKQRWKPSSYGCWYVQTTGIWKTVWMEAVPKTRFLSLDMTPDFPGKKMEAAFCVTPAACTEKTQAVLEVRYKDSARTVLVNRVCVPVLHETTHCTVDLYSTDVNEWGVAPWSPEHPNLYDVKLLLLSSNGQELDTVSSYFGLREIKIEGQQILLNRRPLYQRLILDQGYWEESHLTPPDQQALIEDIEQIMEMGFNGVRKHQKTEDERFLYWCDKKGLLVWSEAPAAYAFSEQAVDSFTRQWTDMVRQNKNHPSVITWTPFNESWGIGEVKTNRQQQHFTEMIYHLTKTLDPTRPVIVNDGWEHTISDILTLHDYEELGEILYRRYTTQKEEILQGLAPHNNERMAFADGYAYCGQPVIISEYGGIAYDSGSGWGYGSRVDGPEAFIERFRSITLAIKKLPYVCGYCYTQVSDVQQEINGLLDAQHMPKLDSKWIREINLLSPDTEWDASPLTMV